MCDVFFALAVLMLLCYFGAFLVILHKSRDLICKAFTGAMLFSILTSYMLLIYHYFISPCESPLDFSIPIAIILLTLAFFLPEFSKISGRTGLVRRIERRYYDPSVVDFMILYTLNWLNVFMFVYGTHTLALHGSEIAQYIMRHPLRLLTISFVWLLGGNVPAEEFPIDYPHIGPGLLLFIINTLILVVTYLNAWFDRLTLRLKHHRLKDKPTGLVLREHAVIWGDRKLIKEIVREYVSVGGVLPRDIVLVSSKMRDIQFISAAGSTVYPRLWAIDGNLGDPDTLVLADMPEAHEFGIIDVFKENENLHFAVNSEAKEDEIISFHNIVSAVSEISVNNPSAQICAVVPTVEDARNLKNVRDAFRKKTRILEEDFIVSAQEVGRILEELSKFTPGIIDVLYDVFSYRNLGSVNSSTNVNIIPIKVKERHWKIEPFMRGSEIYFPLELQDDGSGIQWFVVRGLPRVVGEGLSGTLQPEDLKSQIIPSFSIRENICSLPSSLFSQEKLSLLQLVDDRRNRLISLSQLIDVIRKIEKAEINLNDNGGHGIFYARLKIDSFLLGETILKNFRKRISQLYERKKEGERLTIWDSVIFDIIDVPLFSSILVARCLLTDRGNKLFKYIKNYYVKCVKNGKSKKSPFVVFQLSGKMRLKEIFDKCLEEQAVPIYTRRIITLNSQKFTLIYALKIKEDNN